MLLGIGETPSGVTGGSSSVFVTFGGFRFFIVNYDYEQSYGYGESYFYPLTGGYPYTLNDLSNLFPQEYFEITSLNQLYISEVERLKKAFNTNINSKFKAIGYTSKTGTFYNPIFEYVFAFDFNDIFETSIIGVCSYADRVRLEAYPTWNAIYNVSDSLVGGDGTKKDIFYTNALYCPVDFVERYTWGGSRNWHAGVGVLIFEFTTHYSVLVPRSVPSLQHPQTGGTILGAIFNHYKVTKQSLCCLAQIFGITN